MDEPALRRVHNVRRAALKHPADQQHGGLVGRVAQRQRAKVPRHNPVLILALLQGGLGYKDQGDVVESRRRRGAAKDGKKRCMSGQSGEVEGLCPMCSCEAIVARRTSRGAGEDTPEVLKRSHLHVEVG